MEKDAFIVRLRDFLREANPEIDAAKVGVDQHLFNTGILDSFRVAELLAFIEEVKGERLSLEQMSLDSVATMENIHQTFFGA